MLLLFQYKYHATIT